MKKHHMRTSVAGVGSFVSIPSAFAGADEGIKNVVKVAFTTASSQHSVEKIKPLVSTDVALLDFGAVVPESIDPDKISRDCDLVKEALTKHPRAFADIVREMQRGTAEGLENAHKIAHKAGLTEEHALKAGGGLLGLIIIGAALLLEACGGALREKATSPGATTTPSGGDGSGSESGSGSGSGSGGEPQ